MAKVLTMDGIGKVKKTRRSKKRSRSPSFGWAKVAPKRQFEKKKLWNQCGELCFLRPSNLGYPICSKHMTKKKGCKPDCRGLVAAKSRARAQRSNNIAAKAQRIAARQACSWTR